MTDEPCTGEPAKAAVVTVVTVQPAQPLNAQTWIVQRGSVQVVDFYADAGAL